MGVFDRLLRKWGFVRLRDYGLLLTPDDRVLTTRAGVLDDGTGGRIVGWKSNDLAWSELEAWTPGVVRKPREFMPPAVLALLTGSVLRVAMASGQD